MNINASSSGASKAPAKRRALIAALTVLVSALALAFGGVSFLLVRSALVPSGPKLTFADSPGLDESFPQDTAAAAAGEGPCIPIRVLSSLENAEMAENLVAGYNASPRNLGGSCVEAIAMKDKSGTAAERISNGFAGETGDFPTVWLPDAHSWISIARASGGQKNVSDTVQAVGTSNIVLGMPQPLAAALGWDRTPPTWSDIFETASTQGIWKSLGHPEWGEFKLGKTSPLVASSGQAAMLASFGSSDTGLKNVSAESVARDDVQQQVKLHELATSHYMSTPEQFLRLARQSADSGGIADFLSAVVLDEKSVSDFNRGVSSPDGVDRVEGSEPPEKLIPVYPRDGYYTADNPVVELTGDWVDDSLAVAARDFIRYTGTAQGQQIVREAGYRDQHGLLSAERQKIGLLSQSSAGAVSFPSQEVIAAVADAFPNVRKRAQVLFLVDTSGSMDLLIKPGQSKLDSAKLAMEMALDHFTPGDSVGLQGFASNGEDAPAPGPSAPVADIAGNKDALLSALGKLRAGGYTPLYSALDKAVKERVADWDPETVNAIVVLSDGANETLESRVSLEKLLETIDKTHVTKPLLVFTLAYGTDADVDVLQKISSAANAHFYDATDANRINDVLGDLVTSF